MLDVYEDYPNHHFPPHRWNPQINDTEVAHVTAPWKDCCDNEDDCICVTEDDVNLWNNISSLSGLTGLDVDSLSSVSSLITSADYWNSNYDTVSANSAIWNNVSAIDELSGLDVDALSALVDTVSANSGKWIKYVDPNTIKGDGTETDPYTVKDYENYIKLLNNCAGNIKKLFRDDGKQNWLSLDATTDSNGINPYLKTLFNAIGKKDNDQDVTLNNHGDLIQWIIKNMNVTGKQLQWEYVPASVTSNKESVANLTAEGTMYYHAKPVTAYK